MKNTHGTIKLVDQKQWDRGEMGWITGKLHVFIHWRYADRQPQLLGDRKNPFVILQFSSSTTIRPSLYLVSNRRYHYRRISIIRIITISAALATILECYYCNSNKKRILLLPEPLLLVQQQKQQTLAFRMVYEFDMRQYHTENYPCYRHYKYRVNATTEIIVNTTVTTKIRK